MADAGATNTRVFLWRFVAETDAAVKNIKDLHAVASGFAATTSSALKRTEKSQNAVINATKQQGKATTQSLGATLGALAMAATAWYTLRGALMSTINASSQLSRILALNEEALTKAGVSANGLLNTYIKMSGLALPDLIEATQALVAAGVTSEAAITGMAETAVMAGTAMGISSQQLATVMGRMNMTLGMSTKQVQGEVSALVVLSREAGVSAQALLQIAQNTIYASRITGIATDKFMALGATFQKLGYSAEQAAGMTTEFANMLSENWGIAMAPLVGDVNAFADALEKRPTEAFATLQAGVQRYGKDAAKIFHNSLGMSQSMATGLVDLAGNQEKFNEMVVKAMKAQKEAKAVQDAFDASTANLKDSLTKIWNTIKGVAMTTVTYFMPVIKAVVLPFKALAFIISYLPGPIRALIGGVVLLAMGAMGVAAAIGVLNWRFKGLGTAMTESWVMGKRWLLQLKEQLVRLFALNAANLKVVIWTRLGTVATWLNTAATRMNTLAVVLNDTAKRAAWIAEMKATASSKLHTFWITAKTLATTLWTLGLKALLLALWGAIKAVVTLTLSVLRFAVTEGIARVVTVAWNLSLRALSLGLKGVGWALGGIWKGLLVAVPMLWEAIVATWTWTAALLANPLTWIVLAVVAAVALLVGGFVLLFKYWDKVWGFISKTGGAIVKGVFGALLGAIRGVAKGAEIAGKAIYYMTHPVKAVTAATSWLKKKLFGSSFLHIAEGVAGAMGPLGRLLMMFFQLSRAAEQMHKQVAGDVTVNTGVRGGALGATAVAAEAAGRQAPTPTIVRGGGFGDIIIPITLLLDGTVVAETVARVGKDQLMRMHGMPRRTMRGVPALG